MSVAGQVLPWNQDAPLSQAERQRITTLTQRPIQPGFVQIVEDFPHSFVRHPQASITIGRTFFETDRLPQAWVQACNRLDFVWVATEFNRQTFARSGVAAEKLVVIPECFDPAPYLAAADPAAAQEWREAGQFAFLSVFDWTRHKGWDLLLRGFLEAFEGREDVTLLLKVWSTLGYSDQAIRQQAAEHIRQTTGHDLLSDKRIRWIPQRLTPEAMIGLYHACDAFVLPSRGEGWGRPYLEAMACGLPTLGTNWSGNTAFMHPENAYLLDYRLVPVPETCWPELPTYRGHRWAEPSLADLKRQMRRVVEERSEAQEIGRRAQAEVTERFSRQAVGKLVAAEIERVLGVRCLALGGLSPSAQSVPLAGTKTDTPVSEGGRDRPSHAAAAVASQRPPPNTPTPNTAPLCVRWEGDFFQWHSLASVNREFCTHLLGQGAEVSLVLAGHTHFPPESDPQCARLAPQCYASLSYPAHVHVRHHFPPRFERPDEGCSSC